MSDPDADDNAERAQQLMMGALDGELSDSEGTELHALIETDPSLQREWQRMQRVKKITGTVVLRSPPEEVWDRYWTSVYSRVERGAGWIFFSLGAIVLLSYALWTAARTLMADATVPGFIKATVLLVIVGAVILFVSVAREKWFVYRSDPYRDVQR